MTNAEPLAIRFMVDADTSPGLLLRLLQPFARRDLTPDRMWANCGKDDTHVEIAILAISMDDARLVEGNLRQVIGVRSVVPVSRRNGGCD